MAVRFRTKLASRQTGSSSSYIALDRAHTPTDRSGRCSTCPAPRAQGLDAFEQRALRDFGSCTFVCQRRLDLCQRSFRGIAAADVPLLLLAFRCVLRSAHFLDGCSGELGGGRQAAPKLLRTHRFNFGAVLLNVVQADLAAWRLGARCPPGLFVFQGQRRSLFLRVGRLPELIVIGALGRRRTASTLSSDPPSSSGANIASTSVACPPPAPILPFFAGRASFRWSLLVRFQLAPDMLGASFSSQRLELFLLGGAGLLKLPALPHLEELGVSTAASSAQSGHTSAGLRARGSTPPKSGETAS